MSKYTVLSYCFGNYDILREPQRVDPDAEYVYVTDKEIPSTHWKVVVDPSLAKKDPLYATYYVRHHPFEFASTPIVVTVDSSVQIHDSLAPIVDAFVKSNADYSVLCSIYKSDEHKISEWLKRQPVRVSEHDVNALHTFIKKFGQENWRGAIGQAFNIYRGTPLMRRFSRHVWHYLLALGENGKPNRIDEIVVHQLLARYQDLKLFLTSLQVIQSTYMTYCGHFVYQPVIKYHNYDQYFYLCNKPVYPHRFDKRILFPTSYKYKTEAMLLTKYLNPNDLKEWLDHHLNVCKFDRIHVFDNESDYDVRKVCAEYGNRVTYELIEGQAYQYRLYDSYIESRSNAEWIMPIDDDEFLDIGDFDSVYDAIVYYRNKFPHMDMLAVRWKHLFPKKFKEERTGTVLDYCTEENPELAKKFMHLGDSTVKTIVRRYGKIHYEETWENPAGGHVPKNSVFLGALTCDGRNVQGCGIPDCPDSLEDERIRLLHCRYKGPADWKRKYSGTPAVTVSDSTPRRKRFPFMEILPDLP